MHLHTFFIQGITSKNEQAIRSGLENISGSKPIQADQKSGLYVFLAISGEDPESVTASVATVLTDTGASIFQSGDGRV